MNGSLQQTEVANVTNSKAVPQSSTDMTVGNFQAAIDNQCNGSEAGLQSATKIQQHNVLIKGSHTAHNNNNIRPHGKPRGYWRPAVPANVIHQSPGYLQPPVPGVHPVPGVQHHMPGVQHPIHPIPAAGGQHPVPGVPQQYIPNVPLVQGPNIAVKGPYTLNGHGPMMNNHFNNNLVPQQPFGHMQGNAQLTTTQQQTPVTIAQNPTNVPQNQAPVPQSPVNVPASPQWTPASATLHLAGGSCHTPPMAIPMATMGTGCPIHQNNQMGTPHVMHWDVNHPSGHPVPLRQPNPPVYYNVPTQTSQPNNNTAHLATNQQDNCQDPGSSGSQSPTSDMSGQIQSGGSDASSEDSEKNLQPAVTHGYPGPIQYVVHYGAPSVPAPTKEVFDINGKKINSFDQNFVNRNMQVR